MPDHLSDILDAICRALEAQDPGPVEPTIERDARQHGKVRRRQGYRIDELVRELEVFRQIAFANCESASRPDFISSALAVELAEDDDSTSRSARATISRGAVVSSG